VYYGESSQSFPAKAVRSKRRLVLVNDHLRSDFKGTLLSLIDPFDESAEANAAKRARENSRIENALHRGNKS
jgi:hypothetical protein